MSSIKFFREEFSMFYLILAILCSSMVQIVMRLSTDKVKNNMSMLAVCYTACMLIAAGYTGFDNLLPMTEGIGVAGGLGFLQGLLYLLAFILLQFNDKRNGVVLSASFMKLGLLVPIAVSVVCFGEEPGIFHIIGFAIALVAIVMINYDPRKASPAGSKLGLITLLLVGGMGDVMAKLYQELGNPDLSAQFLLYTFGGALVLSLALMLFKKERPGKAELLYGVLVAIPNYFSSKFLLAALAEIKAVIIYPCYNVGTILVATLAGILLFRERLQKRQWIAMGAILVALVLLNL